MTLFADLPTRRVRLTRFTLCALASALALGAGTAGAQSVAVPSGATNPVIYPAKDQSPRQQDKDKYECYDWARNQSGFDPAQQQAPQQAAPQSAATGAQAAGGVSVSGMAKGAMGGAAIAELGDHDAGKGAAAGAVGAALFEKVKQRQAQMAKEQQMGQQQMQMSQQQAARGQQRATYSKAFSACLEARGYVVK